MSDDTEILQIRVDGGIRATDRGWGQRMQVEELSHIDADLLDRLVGVASAKYYGGELELRHLTQHRRGSSVRYLVARDARGRPLGLAPVYTATPEWDDAVDPTAIFEPPVHMTPAELCLAGSPGTYENYLTVAASARGSEAALVARALAEGSRSLARNAGCAYVMFPYLADQQALWLEEYRAAATAIHVRHKGVLPLIWDTFEDYVAWLPRKRRTEVRRERHRFLQSGIVVREQPLVDVATEVAPLMAQTETRYGKNFAPAQIAAYFMLLGTHLDEDCFALVAHKNDRPIASSVVLGCGDRWVVRGWGCDYAAIGDDYLYFNLVYYEPIMRAIERGVELLDFSVGALSAKRWRGCATERLQTILIPA
ncbi:MAG TPA: GNAT family N-acetyltransferase [Streptosporangiaceae bacterium]|nr:GNAT family N-acetyltransferase [Streptosporangiaceae bacterium]